jgi:hypothetical protein
MMPDDDDKYIKNYICDFKFQSDLNTTVDCTVSMTEITVYQKTGSMTRMTTDGNANYVRKSDDGINDVDDTISSDDVRLDDGCFPAI